MSEVRPLPSQQGENMPTYQYHCDKCGDVEFYQSMNDKTFTECPTCKSNNIKKVFKSNPIIFNGKGFYSTDNRK